MARTVRTIGNPVSWTVHLLNGALAHGADTARAVAGHDTALRPHIRDLTLADLRFALKRGLADLVAFRSDAVFLCLIYPLTGLALGWMVIRGDLFHLLVPVVAGFALLGPMAAIGLYEMSRRRERGRPANWASVFRMIENPRFGAIVFLALLHMVIFAMWIMLADAIHAATLGSGATSSLSEFLRAMTTPAGMEMALLGGAVGFAFAVMVLAFSVVSFPMLLDRDVGLITAVSTSVRVAIHNPAVVAAWGILVAALLFLGSVPLLIGLVFVVPLLGHASWHFYRRAVAWE